MVESGKQGSAPARGNEACSALYDALNMLVEDAVQRAAAKMSSGRGAGGSSSADLRKMVTDAVSAVLLETNILEKLIDRHLKSRAPTDGGGGEAAERTVKDILQAPDFKGAIHKEMKSFLVSQEVKELMDEKFRAITNYLKSDVIPKVVRDQLQKAGT